MCVCVCVCVCVYKPYVIMDTINLSNIDISLSIAFSKVRNPVAKFLRSVDTLRFSDRLIGDGG